MLGAVSPVPRPRPDAAKVLVGKKPSDDLWKKVAELAYAGAAEPVTRARAGRLLTRAAAR